MSIGAAVATGADSFVIAPSSVGGRRRYRRLRFAYRLLIRQFTGNYAVVHSVAVFHRLRPPWAWSRRRSGKAEVRPTAARFLAVVSGRADNAAGRRLGLGHGGLLACEAWPNSVLAAEQ
ncbi:hypothetical protein GCM10020369_28590 [Cryptosporangium minutisporangium]|uniref:Uncharacterized protein n=1 Tax=Cryptosporangium minutisporangium TaxID=113569 RepID=A0ABP6SYK7_9ACTN